MIGSVSTQISLAEIVRSWRRFERGKRRTREILEFREHLERNLFYLWRDIRNGSYQHGDYRVFEVNDTKRRLIAVASVRDRVVHRLLYDRLLLRWRSSFDYDVWSCLPGKGLHDALRRTQKLLRTSTAGYFWRGDIRKCFDSIPHDLLRVSLARKENSAVEEYLLREIIEGYVSPLATDGRARGIPIGNLTSQIFANIFLAEFDRFVRTTLHPRGYLRYGDDFLLVGTTHAELVEYRDKAVQFLSEKMCLTIHRDHNTILPASSGVRFLGSWVYPSGIVLNARNRARARERLTLLNASSYNGLINAFGTTADKKGYRFQISELV